MSGRSEQGITRAVYLRTADVRALAVHAAPAVASVLVSLWMFRAGFLHDRLLGDVGDARWTVAINEHWYRFWTGDEALRDLSFFYPERGTLGASDAFFVQGQLHALARAVGFAAVDAWFLSHFVMFAVGALGVAVLARRVLTTPWAQVAFVVLSCASYLLLAQIGHIQVIGFLWLSWLFVGIDAIHTGTTTAAVRWGVALLAVVPPLLALSSWYAFALGITVLVVLGFFALLLSELRVVVVAARRDAVRVWAAVRTPLGIATIGTRLALWSLAAWIYLPAASLLPDPHWSEVVLFSPRWSDLVNASGLGGGPVWSSIYDRFDADASNPERSLGFTPILLTAFLVVGLGLLRRLTLRRNGDSATDGGPLTAGTRGLVACWLAVLTTLFFFLVDERGFGLFQLVWGRIPGSDAIRAPFRVQILLYPLAIYVVLRATELAAGRIRSRAQMGARGQAGAARTTRTPRWKPAIATLLGVLLGTAIFVEMHRPTYSFWRPDDLLAAELRVHADDVEEACEAVILTEWSFFSPEWAFAIDAVMLSMLSGVPTPQGYSRAVPIGHPGSAPTLRASRRGCATWGTAGRSASSTALACGWSGKPHRAPGNEQALPVESPG